MESRGKTKLRKSFWKQYAAGLGLSSVLLAAACLSYPAAVLGHSLIAQESIPAPPADRALIYLADERGALAALPFETGVMPIKTDEVAKSDKISYVELKGASASTTAKNDEPRLYVFVPDQPGAHPPFLVRLTNRKGARRVTAITQRGMRGYAIASEEIVKPRYRVLGREGGMVYMEIRPREALLPGEYAIVGTDLQRIATFRVAPVTMP
jgi:hypothetical protein